MLYVYFTTEALSTVRVCIYSRYKLQANVVMLHAHRKKRFVHKLVYNFESIVHAA